MPKKKIIHKKSRNISSADSYKSLLYGVATVIILFLLGFSAVKFFISRPKPEIDNQAVNITNNAKLTQTPPAGITPPSQSGSTYTVKAGESLWDIAEAVYHDGYKWTEIAKANNLANPDTIFKDDKLIIPAEIVTPTPAQTAVENSNPASVPASDKIVGSTYTVKRGDDLWNIAVRAYGDGYQWIKIAQANNLSDPSLIFSDNVLKIPR